MISMGEDHTMCTLNIIKLLKNIPFVILFFLPPLKKYMYIPRSLGGEESACNAGDTRDAGSVPGFGRSPGEGNGNPLQYSCLENPMDRGAWRATIHKIAKSRTQLKRLSTCSFKLFQKF